MEHQMAVSNDPFRAANCGCIAALQEGAGLRDADIVAIARSCRALEELQLRAERFVSDSGIVTLARSCPRLRNIGVSGCVQLSDISLRALGDCCAHLEHIDMSSCPRISDRPQALPQHPWLLLCHHRLRGLHDVAASSWKQDCGVA